MCPDFPIPFCGRARTIRSIANLTRRDGEEFLNIAHKAGIRTVVETFPGAGH
ncbi:hypothetical protein NTGM5_460006 [Candidatus Nitrotoga sp. M5]|nr:hypothetical protein NTGM5_460006 [Candidatus Nitrotoga sp. M5]